MGPGQRSKNPSAGRAKGRCHVSFPLARYPLEADTERQAWAAVVEPAAAVVAWSTVVTIRLIAVRAWVVVTVITVAVVMTVTMVAVAIMTMVAVMPMMAVMARSTSFGDGSSTPNHQTNGNNGSNQ